MSTDPKSNIKLPRNPSLPPPSLLSLPVELLSRVISALDLPSSISLARVHPSLVSLTEPTIWRSISVVLPQEYDIDTVSENRASRRQYLSEKERDRQLVVRKLETSYRMALREKAKKILLHGTARTLGLVHEASFSPRPGVIPEMLLLLEYVAPNLRSLVFERVFDYDYYEESGYWDLPDIETFDYRINQAKITFTSLTHVRLRDSPIRSSCFVHFLLDSAPKLVHLDVDLGKTSWGYDDDDEESVKESMWFSASTSLRFLRFGLPEERIDGEYPSIYLSRLLRQSPDLRQVALGFGDDDKGEDEVMSALCSLKNLRDLNWLLEPDDFCGMYKKAKETQRGAFPCLQRLILCSEDCVDLPLIPKIPTLQTYQIIYDCPEKELANASSRPVVFPLPRLAQRIRKSSGISELYHLPLRGDINRGVDLVDFSDLNDEQILASRLVAKFTTIRHGDEDLLIIRFLTSRYEISDTPYASSTGQLQPGETRVRYESDGICRVKLYRHHKHDDAICLGWQEMSDYAGRVVPREVMRRMREVEGATEEEWTGRGIEVGDAAWQVLTDWSLREVE